MMTSHLQLTQVYVDMGSPRIVPPHRHWQRKVGTMSRLSVQLVFALAVIHGGGLLFTRPMAALGNARIQRGTTGSGAAATTAPDSVQGRYGDASYWDDRFRTQDKGMYKDRIDDRGSGWLCGYEGPLQQTLHAITEGDKNLKVLNLGCGVDRLSEDIYADGYENLLSVDASPSAIQEMRDRTAKTMPKAQWEVENALSMRIPSSDVDVVVDKGTLDAILAGPYPILSAAAVLAEVQRVLPVGGMYVLVSHGRGDPKENRWPLLQLPHLRFDVNLTPDLGGYYIFLCRKIEQLSPEELQQSWNMVEEWAKAEDEAAEAASKAVSEDEVPTLPEEVDVAEVAAGGAAPPASDIPSSRGSSKGATPFMGSNRPTQPADMGQ
mmetsp:Transcript_69710/g.130112  ORF Transcript_69710/g.130112 Transcript_69710/m.130112 type:complete len:378 (+) Transcript_69710:31-1164(+)